MMGCEAGRGGRGHGRGWWDMWLMMGRVGGEKKEWIMGEAGGDVRGWWYGRV